MADKRALRTIHVVGPTRSDAFAELIDAIAVLRGFLEGRDDSMRLTAAETKTLERLVERYHRAADGVSRSLESVLVRSTRRPRR